MDDIQPMAGPRRDEILQDSIRDRSRLVLTHRSETGWRTYRSRFVDGSGPSAGFAVQLLPGPGSDTAILPQPGETLGVSFRSGRVKCVFSAVLDSTRHVAGGPVLTLQWPDLLQTLQRRAFERVAPPRGTMISVRFWSGMPPAASPTGNAQPADDDTQWQGQLEDLSAGGMRIKVARGDGMQPGSIYHCVFAPRPRAPRFTLDAILRHIEAPLAGGTPDRGRICLGFQFIGLETTTEGQRTLDRLAQLVSRFQRARHRASR